MAKFLEDAQNPEFQSALEQAFREMSPEGNEESIGSLLGSLKQETKESNPLDVNEGIAKTLQVEKNIYIYIPLRGIRFFSKAFTMRK